MSEHTKTPWTPGKPPHDHTYVYGVDPLSVQPQFVAEVYGNSHEQVTANVRRIVTAVNTHDDLLEACKAQWFAEEHHDTCEDCDDGSLCITGSALYHHARQLRAAAIAKAEEAPE